jgi:hypothetical protein
MQERGIYGCINMIIHFIGFSLVLIFFLVLGFNHSLQVNIY